MTSPCWPATDVVAGRKPTMKMLLRISTALCCSLLLATAAAAQLASQTALVGTVTDSGGGVMPGAQVLAVNQGTKDTYEATTNAEGYFHIQFVRPGQVRNLGDPPGLPDVQDDGRRGFDQPGRAHQRDAPAGRRGRNGERRSQGPGAEYRQRHDLGDDRRAGDPGVAAERPQRLEPGDHDTRGVERGNAATSARASGARVSGRSRTGCRSTASARPPTCWR